MTIAIGILLVGVLLVGVRVARTLDSIAEINSLSLLATKPAREDLPDDWAVIELGDQVLVTVDGEQSLQEVTEIHDNGCLTLGEVGT